jgi:hypothetical protein
MRAVIVFLMALPALLLLMSCASGVRMTDADAVICRDDPRGCTAWTAGELAQLRDAAIRAGYRQGWVDAMVQAGREL